MRSIKFLTLAFTPVLMSTVLLSNLLSPRPSLGAGGSHGKAQMCAKYKYTALGKDGKIDPRRSGSTTEHCGSTYNKQHHNTGVQQRSKKEACNAAKAEFKKRNIKLVQGEKWKEKRCESYQKNRG